MSLNPVLKMLNLQSKDVSNKINKFRFQWFVHAAALVSMIGTLLLWFGNVPTTYKGPIIVIEVVVMGILYVMAFIRYRLDKRALEKDEIIERLRGEYYE